MVHRLKGAREVGGHRARPGQDLALFSEGAYAACSTYHAIDRTNTESLFKSRNLNFKMGGLKKKSVGKVFLWKP